MVDTSVTAKLQIMDSSTAIRLAEAANSFVDRFVALAATT
jgi:hypothetical protein